jgi:acetylornithine deacetylase
MNTHRPSPVELQALVEELVSVDSVNPDLVPGAAGEGEIALLVGSWLAERGVAVRYQEAAPRRLNVIGRVAGHGGGRSLMLNAHLDTVGTESMPDALRPVIRDGRLYGRGAHDTKSGLAAAMVATVAAIDMHLRGDVVLAAVVDEEGESKGTEALLTEWVADAGIVLEPTGQVIVPAHKGFMWADVETLGVAAHGSDPEHGVDAILGMGYVMVELDALATGLRHRPPAGALGTGSLHASLIGGGRELPTYPDRCSLVVERRTVPGDTAEKVLAELEAAIAAAHRHDASGRWTAAASLRLARPPLATPRDDPVVVAVAEACAAMAGSVALGPVAFWTDAALMSAAGISSVVFGAKGDGMHSASEWVNLESVQVVADVLVDSARRLCG